MIQKTALVIGATGLIGKALITALLDSNTYLVKAYSRRTTGVEHPNFEEIITDFTNLNAINHNITGDVLFSVLGTTLKTAGSKKKQYEIDYTYQFNFAEIAANNGVSNLVLLSSAGAKANASIFYSKMKGELDEAVKALPFKKTSIIRPSMLQGNREEFRWSEKILTPIMKAFSWIPGIKKYRPIRDSIVAEAMINACFIDGQSYTIFELEEVFTLAETPLN